MLFGFPTQQSLDFPLNRYLHAYQNMGYFHHFRKTQTPKGPCQYLHKYLPEKDTMIFYTHHFHVLPRQQ
jgi:hypothetical protein